MLKKSSSNQESINKDVFGHCLFKSKSFNSFVFLFKELISKNIAERYFITSLQYSAKIYPITPNARKLQLQGY